MLNADLNNAAVFAGTTGNGADLAVVVGRDHHCLFPRVLKPSGKRLLTAYCTTPAVRSHAGSDSEDMSKSSERRRTWQRQHQPVPVDRTSGVGQSSATVTPPAMWASLIIQQTL